MSLLPSAGIQVGCCWCLAVWVQEGQSWALLCTQLDAVTGSFTGQEVPDQLNLTVLRYRNASRCSNENLLEPFEITDWIRSTNQGLDLIQRTNFSQSASAFCLRRISTSTWLRACFSLTSKAPLSVSVLVSTSLQDPSSCSVLSHLRRQSSKFCAIWMKSGKEDAHTVVRNVAGICTGTYSMCLKR